MMGNYAKAKVMASRISPTLHQKRGMTRRLLQTQLKDVLAVTFDTSNFSELVSKCICN